MLDKQTVYKKQIQKHLYFGGELSCSDLSDLTEKSIPLTSKIINELIDEGSVIESGFANSTGGRRPQMYSLKSDVMYIVAVSMDQLVTRVAILDMQNNFAFPIENFELTLANNPKSLYQLLDLLKNYIQKSGIAKNKIVGIGIGMPGFVDIKKSINNTYLKPARGNVVSELESELGVPVFIDNDSSLVALAELKFGKARNRKNSMVINIGWGVGLGMILNGELFRGNNGFAGEFSHIPIFTNNKICGCGKSGCLETETSLLVIIDKAIKGIKEGKSTSLKDISMDHPEAAAHSIIEAALHGDSFSIDLITEVGYNIGRGVAIHIHILNPELIVLSGRGSLAGRLWRAPIQQAINKLCIPKIAEDTTIEISQMNYQAEIIGTACLVMDQIDKRKFLLTHEKSLIS